MGGCCKKTHMHPQTQHSGTHSEIVGEPASVGGQGADTQIQPKILVVMGKIGTQQESIQHEITITFKKSTSYKVK